MAVAMLEAEVESMVEVPMEHLEAQIREEAAHLDAATCRWLVQVAEFDRRMGWADWQMRSAAHWLNWQCGVALSTAREQVRVAHQLVIFPRIREVFAAGRLSYSKVRALTRVASPENVDTLVDMALEATAAQLDRIVRSYKGIKDDEEKGRSRARHDRRFFNWHWDDDGSFVFSGRLDTDDGMVLLTALGMASDALGDPRPGVYRPPVAAPEPGDASAGAFAEGACEASAGVFADGGCDASAGAFPDGECDASAGASSGRLSAVETIPTDAAWRPQDDPAVPQSSEQARADALVAVAETMLAAGPTPRPGGARNEVVVHVDADSLATGGTAVLEGGPSVGAEFVRQMLCDCGIVAVIEDSSGRTIDVGRRTRRPNRALRRALKLRDKGCQFPGCTQELFVDGHHVTHWGQQGRTTLDNMVLLCRRHHKAVHLGWTIECRRSGEFVFRRPDGRVVPPIGAAVTGHADRPVRVNRELGLAIDDQTSQPGHPGPCDYSMAVDALAFDDGRLDWSGF